MGGGLMLEACMMCVPRTFGHRTQAIAIGISLRLSLSSKSRCGLQSLQQLLVGNIPHKQCILCAQHSWVFEDLKRLFSAQPVLGSEGCKICPRLSVQVVKLTSLAVCLVEVIHFAFFFVLSMLGLFLRTVFQRTAFGLASSPLTCVDYTRGC
jgi:hypothetical protein